MAVLCGKCCDPLNQLGHTREQHSSAGEPVSADAASTIAECPESDAEQFIPILETPQQKFAYLIVNAFTHDVALDDPSAEALIKIRVINKPRWSPEILQQIDDVFKKVFFEFPNGVDNQDTWEPRDSTLIIEQWKEAAWFRRFADARGNYRNLLGVRELPDCTHLTKEQVKRIKHYYTEWFIEQEADPQQREDSFNANKSRGEARLRERCGHMHVVFGIWAVGLPHIHLPSSTDDATEHIQQNTDNILEWLSHLANAIMAHRATISYKTQKRKSGQAKGTHGLTAAEYEQRTKAKSYQYAKHLSQRWNNGTLTSSTCNAYQWELLQKFWNGKLEEIKPKTQPTMPSFHKR